MDHLLKPVTQGFSDHGVACKPGSPEPVRLGGEGAARYASKVVEQGYWFGDGGFDVIDSRPLDGEPAIHLPRIDIFPDMSPSTSPVISNPSSI